MLVGYTAAKYIPLYLSREVYKVRRFLSIKGWPSLRVVRQSVIPRPKERLPIDLVTFRLERFPDVYVVRIFSGNVTNSVVFLLGAVVQSTL